MIRKLIHQTRRRLFHGCCDWKRHNASHSPSAYIQIIAAKFLLEVLGAAGAVWGNCDIFLLRTTDEGNRISRIYSTIVGVIFLIRYYWHSKHRFQTGGDFMLVKEPHRRKHRVEFVQIHASKFILQVLGGAGAVWGSAEVATLRNPSTTSEWRLVSVVVGCIFLIRWMFQISAYCLCIPTRDPTTFMMSALRFFDAFIVTFILEVLGAAGAVWGSSEIATLRHPKTNETWRAIASVVGVIFLIRWILHLRSFFQSERGVFITVKNADEVKDLDTGIEDLQLKESDSAETEVTVVEEYPIMNEAVPVICQEPSGAVDRQVSLEYPTESTSMLNMQPTGILHRQISARNSPPPSPKHFFPSPRREQLEP